MKKGIISLSETWANHSDTGKRMDDLVICKTEHDGSTFLTAAFYKEMKLSLLRLAPEREEQYRPGTILIGKVERKQQNTGSTYIRIGKEMYYLSGNTLRTGEELPVQIIKTPTGGKRAAVDTRLTLTGRYGVVSYDPAGEKEQGSLSLSKKMTAEQRQVVRTWINGINLSCFDVTVRTNAVSASEKDVTEEIKGLIGVMNRIRRDAGTRTCFSVLYEPPAFGTEMLCEIREEIPDRIVTDQRDIYERILERTEKEPWLFGGTACGKVLLYSDASVPLTAVYNLNRDIGRLLEKKVYLKSGAYLIIEKTEAFVSIDVNTGKCVKGKNPEETYFSVNLEAAAEAARQIILRNLSGMILIDFINMKEHSHEEELLRAMQAALKADPYGGRAVDMTKLGIMEIVRPRRGEPIR